MNTQFTAIVQTLIAEQGKDALINAAKCRAFLPDYTKSEFIKERRLLLKVVETGAAREIEAAENIEICKKLQVRHLQEELFMAEDIAVDVVDMLAFVLRCDTSLNKPLTPQPAPQKPELYNISYNYNIAAQRNAEMSHEYEDGNTCANQSFEKKQYIIETKYNTVPINVEIARSYAQCTQGLRYRKTVPEGTGMLFVFEREQILSFWMENILVPLSIAFISYEGRIVEIRDMEPLSLTIIQSSRSTRYALAVPQGWFDKVCVNLGSRIKFLENEYDNQ